MLGAYVHELIHSPRVARFSITIVTNTDTPTKAATCVALGDSIHRRDLRRNRHGRVGEYGKDRIAQRRLATRNDALPMRRLLHARIQRHLHQLPREVEQKREQRDVERRRPTDTVDGPRPTPSLRHAQSA